MESITTNFCGNESERRVSAAAITLQKYTRGYLARKAVLPSNLFSQYFTQCEKAKGPESSKMPRVMDGRTTVYLPKEASKIVLKESGRFHAIRRFHQMQGVRAVLSEQKSTHLVVPRASLCGDFLVEQRLPINTDPYHNMGLYLSDPKIFDNAVREMTRLFSKVYLGDLVGNSYIPLGHIPGVEDYVRYDNLPLYVETVKGESVGKIGLIDLEHIKKDVSPKGLNVLVRIFPLHAELIKEEAKSLGMEVDEKSLDNESAKGKKFLQVGFADHLDWLKKKGISGDCPFKFFELSLARVKEISRAVEKELLSINEGKQHALFEIGNFLVENPGLVATELASIITPVIIKDIQTEINERQSQKSNIFEHDLTDSELVSLRSPLIYRPQLFSTAQNIIFSNPRLKLNNRHAEAKYLADQVTSAIMQELVKGGEIFFFDPAHYSHGHQCCWLRY